MRNFDVLTKPDNFYTWKTMIGGIATIILIGLAFIALVKELKSFRQLKVVWNLYLDPKPNQEQIKVSLDILLRHVPCGII